MEPTISIPQGWHYPRFTFGQRTERGTVIGMKYYAQDTFLADEYGAGWRYILLLDKNTEDEETHLEDEIKLLSSQELKTVVEAEINTHLRQVELLKHELKAADVSSVTTNFKAEIESQEQIQKQTLESPLNLQNLIDAAKFIIKEIVKHPEYLALNYQPNLTVGDAETALSYLESELEPHEDSN